MLRFCVGGPGWGVNVDPIIGATTGRLWWWWELRFRNWGLGMGVGGGGHKRGTVKEQDVLPPPPGVQYQVTCMTGNF